MGIETLRNGTTRKRKDHCNSKILKCVLRSARVIGSAVQSPSATINHQTFDWVRRVDAPARWRNTSSNFPLTSEKLLPVLHDLRSLVLHKLLASCAHCFQSVPNNVQQNTCNKTELLLKNKSCDTGCNKQSFAGFASGAYFGSSKESSE
ncbi:hypothetical protein RvY_07820 [Ramazzottius varieornatus]|uniref:Uncharacterized protein n=1 Tax=Ramazzottius varieornatus TaxID=947166 RepID=A0A1D1V3J3_RAMVA|nr:hypothetical protein RvY_07820 [Ramazzottius varieornatus]